MLSHYEYDLLKAPAGREETALLVGTVVHKAFEALLVGKDWRKAGNEALVATPHMNEGQTLALMLAAEQWTAVATAIDSAWKTPEDWEILGVEQEMEVPCGVHTVVGRLDAMVRWNGNLWHLQHKTVPTNKNLVAYAEQQRTDWHESVYQRMAERSYPGETVAGTLLNCIRKISLKTAREKPLTAFEFFFLPRSTEEVNEAFADIEQEINDIQDEHEGKKRIVKNRSYCTGQYGNSVCAYKDVCDGRAEITDTERFVTIEPRYSPTDV